MSIPLSDSVQMSLDRLETILASSLFTDELDLRDTENYPLDHPEKWCRFRLNLSRHWRSLNVDQVIGVIHPRSGADVLGTYSGDGSTYSQTQRVPVDVGIVVKAPDAFTAPKGVIDDEWMQKRIEQYRAAILEIVPKYAADGEGIKECMVSEHMADIAEQPDFGRYAHATITFDIMQDVNINTR